MEIYRTQSEMLEKVPTGKLNKPLGEMDDCPERESGRDGEISVCRAISKALGARHGVTRSMCRTCQAQGAPDVKANVALRRWTAAIGWNRLFPTSDPVQLVPITDDEREGAVRFIDGIAGREAAHTLVNTLYARGHFADAEAAADCAERAGIIEEDGHGDEGADAR